MSGLQLREAVEADVPLIFNFIKGLAEYEKLSDEVYATEAILSDSLFTKNAAKVIIASYDDNAAGFALYFYNFSTFTGKRGLYLEDLFILPEFRSKGVGKALLKELAQIAEKEDCARMEWVALDWNTPAINFYKAMGAVEKNEWTIDW
ncbi:hypothetical protein SmJEL517_g00820 [Synchytrium microbalum]|uniref:N-acetyltransferase domain-containing protein n=1 Tax=Synchytrium microbalum TaxID=1806994 RepID=A0A507CG93_9FUNG|nr:uncharacterized protein SmJEL517_g00820 [Synchytrium microbalum]TPX37026.1 hypothetical protein SmJEL517_g00820 [Synchytrium microbalum]